MQLKLSLKISLEGTRLEADKPFLSKSKVDILSSSIRTNDCLFGSALVGVIGLYLGALCKKSHVFNIWNTLRMVRCSLNEKQGVTQTNGEHYSFCFLFHTQLVYIHWVGCQVELPMIFTLKIFSASHLNIFDEQ